LLPDEITIVYDGDVPNEIDLYLKSCENILIEFNIFLNIVILQNNVGLGDALNFGLKKCRNDIIVRVDSDDVNLLDRFQKQLSYFTTNRLDVVGGAYYEFNNVPGDSNIIKFQPTSHQEIFSKSKFLNPISHPTVMFSKKAVL
jgi:glycosyltransferase involved in cell wall biosynthesis